MSLPVPAPFDANFPAPNVQPVYMENGAVVLYNKTKSINGASWDSRDDFPNDIDVSKYSQLFVAFLIGTTTPSSGPTITLYAVTPIPGQAVTFDMADTTALPELSNKFTSIGPGCQFNSVIGTLLRLEMTSTGAPTQVNFTIVVIAR